MAAAEDLSKAAQRLAAGELVAFPTETVYGLGADATNAAAVTQVFALKGRPADHPLIVHFADPEEMEQWAAPGVPREARVLAARFWPGPLTIILRKSPRVPDVVTGGQETVGLRCPSHPVARALLEEFREIGSGAIAAPSANRFGHVSPTTAAHVRDEFGPDLLVLDGGECEVGLESTIIDLSRGRPVLLRPGAITREDIALALGVQPADRDLEAPRAPGMLAAHYAPHTALAIVEAAALDMELAHPANIAVLALREPPPTARVISWITAPFDVGRYAHDLYANLRKLDASGAKRIVVEAPPTTAPWEAVNDRLWRAAAGTGPVDDEP
ncbi:MAG TPA: L-threonylcarbamoyladenylate synthase [Usitatibacter sp.]|jgi:L-threonylcarbamoyladenylate synthase|nr:L-threonylcarbamoyladenylate synthase [Usitatibacter sp.]